MGAVEGEARNGHVEPLPGFALLHLIGAAHDARGRGKRRAAGVFEAVTRPQDGLLADHARPANLLDPAAGIGDAPVAIAQLHRSLAVVLDADVIGPHEPLDRKSTRLNSSHVEISY